MFCFSICGSGELWSWLQAIVGLSNLISWWVIGVVSIRFRRGLENKEEPMSCYSKLVLSLWSLIRCNFRWIHILVQGWTTFSPFSVNDFSSPIWNWEFSRCALFLVVSGS